MRDTLKALAVASSIAAANVPQVAVATDPQVASAKDATSSEVISICSKKKKLANREEKIFFMDAFKEIKYAVKNTKNPNIEVIILPDTDGDESTSPTVESEAKEEGTDILIPLEVPVDIDGRTYNGIHISYNKDYEFFYSRFYNIKQDNIKIPSFPMNVFIFSAPNNSGTSLCQEQKYYDEISGYNFNTGKVQGKNIDFDSVEFEKLVTIALRELNK